jgi:MoaA/NifB/PqqE/SkfB family radical SAM enzyme
VGYDLPLRRLPLLTLYLTERCNSRCVTCDYWRHGREDLSLESVRSLLPDLEQLQTRVVLISGGEPLVHRQWRDIATLLRAAGLKLWLLTSGVALLKHARAVAELFDSITVSLDGADASTYARIRGIDAFDQVCAGIRALARSGAPVDLRVTLQRENFRQLRELVHLAHELGARHISFLAVDVANPSAFARREAPRADIALAAEDIDTLAALVNGLEKECAPDFRSGFILESPAKLRRLVQYFAAVLSEGPYPAVRCNAPEFSAVVTASMHVQPCFFIPGPPHSRTDGRLASSLNEPAMRSLRADIRAKRRPECARCVCSMWRDAAVDTGALLPPQPQPYVHG